MSDKDLNVHVTQRGDLTPDDAGYLEAINKPASGLVAPQAKPVELENTEVKIVGGSVAVVPKGGESHGR